jgi:hypothetical protein
MVAELEIRKWSRLRPMRYMMQLPSMISSSISI